MLRPRALDLAARGWAGSTSPRRTLAGPAHLTWAGGRRLPPMRIYDCRHAAATTWLRAGVPLGEVARRLGHSVETLVSTYVGALDGTWAFSGRCGIRTHGDPEATTAFEAAPFVRSGNLPGLQATSETWRLRRGSMPSHHDRARSRARGVARGVGLPGLGEAAHRLLEHRRFGGVGEPEMALVLAGG
jgi:hypothetical protein